jgi:hypothetical protein
MIGQQHALDGTRSRSCIDYREHIIWYYSNVVLCLGVENYTTTSNGLLGLSKGICASTKDFQPQQFQPQVCYQGLRSQKSTFVNRMDIKDGPSASVASIHSSHTLHFTTLNLTHCGLQKVPPQTHNSTQRVQPQLNKTHITLHTTIDQG